MSEHPPSAWIVLGGIHLLNGTAPRRPDDPLVLLPVPPQERVRPSNTVVVRWPALGGVEAVTLLADCTRGPNIPVKGAELFPDGALGSELAGWTGKTSAVPLCYLSCAADDGFYVYSQVRFLAEDACFVRVTQEPVGCGAAESLSWLEPALEAHAKNALFLNNHQRYYRKCFPGQELEYKFTLDPPPDIWALTVTLHQRIRRGELSGFIPEYRDEFQAWDYGNYLFEVVGPEAELGYVSFIPTTDGKQLMKRKWYAKDAFSRREQHTYGLDLDPSQHADYVRTVLGLEARPMPPFRRVRYDVNFESVRTGHVYGVFFDHCSLQDAPEVTLSQCELEYLRTRSPLEPDGSSVLGEMAGLAHWVEGYLREHGIQGERSYYSKRTFLQEAVRRRPELARAAG